MKKLFSGKFQLGLQALAMVVIIILANVVLNVYYKRIDLTEDKRFTLSEPTIKLLSGLKDAVYIKVYLEGKGMPPGFNKMHDAIQDMLNEFRIVAGDKIQYQFISPDAMPDKASRDDLLKQLANQGLTPMEVQANEDDKLVQKLIVPGAMLSLNNKNAPAVFINQQVGNLSPEEELNNATMQVEYQLANAVRKLLTTQKQKVAFITGHGELDTMYTADIRKSFREFYDVDLVDLPKYKVGRLDGYKAIVVAKPTLPFSELEKYKIDQFVMRGGRVLWLQDALQAEMDSLRGTEMFATDYQLNLDDLPYKYGVRVNYNLVQDLNCHFIPLLTSSMGSQPQGTQLKWPYFPVITAAAQHPIVTNLGPVLFQFGGTLDTLSSARNIGIKKTVLLQTSPYTKVMSSPVHIDLKMVRGINSKTYHSGFQNVAVLLEGKFTSLFANRLPPNVTESGQYGKFIEKGADAKIIVVSDGDVIKNAYSQAKQMYYPLGFDPWTNQNFNNKAFIMNCMDYMVDESGLISLRTKQYTLRLLDAGLVKAEKNNWKIINMVVPILLIIIFGIIYNYIRKRRFAG
ncbi:MAG: gliding motility-associated ABC transporter substrate-binding protein GldG [Bacteroidetes bacterium]|nr:gliding motility-associated ABC transporter substrate-binding protein GldG [Bacteroidota bacterium]